MATTEQIREALAALDPARDSDWTHGGLPMMDAVRTLTDETATRRQVENASPGFTRDNPVLAPLPDSVTGVTVEGVNAGQTPKVTVNLGTDWAAKSPSERAEDASTILETPPDAPVAAPRPGDALRVKVAELTEAHRLLTADIKAAQAKALEIQDDIDAALREIEVLEPPESAAAKYARISARHDEERRIAVEAARRANPFEVSALDRRLGSRRVRRRIAEVR